MNYYFSKSIHKSYDEAHAYVEQKLKDHGLGIVTELEMHKKFKEKLNINFRPYKILGACSPKHAYKAVSVEEHIGLMLPCNVVIQDKGENQVEVSVIDPIASMQSVDNPLLKDTAREIQDMLKKFIKSL